MLTKEFINAKFNDYLNDAIAAEKCGDTENRMKYAKALVILTRMEARESLVRMTEAREHYHATKRSMLKAKERGITFLFGGARLEQMKQDVDFKRKLVVSIGRMMCSALDMWELAGATLHDLCVLCNRDYVQVLTEIDPEHRSDPLKRIISVYTLDYKDPRNRGWLEDDVDAPMTHSIKEFVLDQMLHTARGRADSNHALQECFPELWENRMHIYTDDDGEQHIIDRDGVEIDSL